jgi:hypothetical protein
MLTYNHYIEKDEDEKRQKLHRLCVYEDILQIDFEYETKELSILKDVCNLIAYNDVKTNIDNVCQVLALLTVDVEE